MQIQGLITPGSLVFIDMGGYPYHIDGSHPNFDKIKGLFKNSQGVGSDQDVKNILKQMVGLADVSKTIKDYGDGIVTVEDGVVLYNDGEVHGTIVTRILEGINEGFDMKPYISFLKNLMSNPSQTAIAELYDFMEYGGMGITDDGHILGYKKIRNDYTDCHSGKFDNHPGMTHEMSRGTVDDNRHRTCSTGFHFCSFDYLAQFGSGRNGEDRVVLVKVNPRDVVAIPSDYNNTKARCCGYTVLSELEDYSSNRLRERSVWTNTNIHQPDMSNSVAQEEANPDWEWADVEKAYQNEDMDLQDNIFVITGEDYEDIPELVEYHLDSMDRTVNIRVHIIRDEEVYSTQDADLISKVFEFIKSRAALTGEKQLVKIVRV